jgi:CheY-like chemotaxis protein
MDEQRCDPVVLLIDDDEMERFLYRQALEQEGFEIVEAEDGAAALEAFALAAPDIIMLDVIMPKIDGFAACQAIRALPAGRNIPILMATGLDDVESIDKPIGSARRISSRSRSATHCCRTGSATCFAPTSWPRPRELLGSHTFVGCRRALLSTARRTCRGCSA